MAIGTDSSKNFLGQDLEMEIIKMITPLIKQKYFADVGAEKGSFSSVMFSLGLQGVMFEPMKRHHPILNEMAKSNKSALYPLAIDENDGVRDLFVATDTENNELDFFHSLHQIGTTETKFQHSKSIQVNCRSLASLAAEKIIPETIGILKIDTEGNDIFVLKGMGELRPELIVCEYFTDGMYSGWENARPEIVIEYLRSKGYSRYLATKRVGVLEYCTPNPVGFIPNQWGNLFFFSDRLYTDAEAEISKFLTVSEASFISLINFNESDRVAKEGVIRVLEAEVERLNALNFQTQPLQKKDI